MPFDLSELNPQQKVAASTVSGSVLVIAGAGSGKTKTLTYRIANLIYYHNVKPYEILAITFTNKAARELLERVAWLLSENKSVLSKWGSVEVSTFHKFGAKLLRRFSAYVEREPNFIIYDKSDSESILKQILKELDVDANHYPISWLIKLLSETKNNFLTYDEIVEKYPKDASLLKQIFEKYENHLKRANAFDLDDLLFVAVKLLKQNESILEIYRRQLKFIHVDEYQDTNLVQLELLKLLDGGRSIIFAVGDEDQAIYGWRGANIRNILQFQSDFNNVKIIKLEQNYRSTPGILRSANAVIVKNIQRQKKSLWTNNPEGEKIKLITAFNPDEEAQKVIDWLRIDKTGTKAVLFRTNAQSLVFEQYCIKNKLPYKLVGTVKFFERKEIKDVMAYIKILTHLQDDVAFTRAISTPSRGIGKTSLDKIRLLANEFNKSFFDVIQLDNFSELFKGRIPKGLFTFIQDLIHQRSELQKVKNPTQIIRNWLIGNGYIQAIKNEIGGEERLRNIDELFIQMDTFFQKNEESSLVDFLEFVTLQSEQDDLDDDTSGILLMTCHASKGLEFDSVAVVGLEETLFPLGDEYTEDMDFEEERRLFYVAMTRAKKRLALSRALIREKFGVHFDTSPSRFLMDIPIDELEGDIPSFFFQSQYFNFFTYVHKERTDTKNKNRNTIDFKVGLRIYHPSFGKGKITQCSKYEDGFKIVVEFDNAGQKTLLTKYAQITIES